MYRNSVGSEVQHGVDLNAVKRSCAMGAHDNVVGSKVRHGGDLNAVKEVMCQGRA